MFTFLEAFFTQYGYAAVFLVLVACGFGVPIPEDITLVTGGIIAGLGHAHVHTMFMVSIVGVLIGDGIMFMAGRFYGDRILRFRLIQRLMTPKRYAKVQEKFDKYGNRVLFIARFLPGLRTPIYITAGVSQRITFLQFFIMDGLAALISVPIWVYLGWYGAGNIDWVLKKVHQFQTALFIIIAIIVIGVLWRWYQKRTQRAAK